MPTLYIAYRSASSEVTMSGLQVTFGRRGSSGWWTPWVVTNVDGTHKKAQMQPALASYQDILHMIYTTYATSDYIKWTYFDGSTWSPDVSIASQEMEYSASLSARSNLLTMVHSSSASDQYWNQTQVYSEYFQ